MGVSRRVSGKDLTEKGRTPHPIPSKYVWHNPMNCESSPKKNVRWVWWHMPAGYVEGVEDREFKASLGYQWKK